MFHASLVCFILVDPACMMRFVRRFKEEETCQKKLGATRLSILGDV